jgi:hypothetical protein
MHPRFSIALDAPRDLVIVVMTGLLLPADVADFFEARRKVHARLECATGRHVTLTDLRAMSILPQETVDAFAILLTDPQSIARRLAFVVGPTLVRSPLLRALGGRDARFFADPAEAKAWLLDEDEGAARRPPARHKPPYLRAVA